jgi:hypothetical protein
MWAYLTNLALLEGDACPLDGQAAQIVIKLDGSAQPWAHFPQ